MAVCWSPAFGNRVCTLPQAEGSRKHGALEHRRLAQTGGMQKTSNRVITVRSEFGESSSRREALLFLGSSALVIPSSLALVQEAEAADLTQRIQRGEFLATIKTSLRNAVGANQELIPDLLRLALNDIATYDKETKTGGANGSVIFSEELSRPENAGLDAAVQLLTAVKAEVDADSKGGPISWADLIQIGGSAAAKKLFLASAIKKAGGDEVKGRQLYFAFGSEGQWGFFDKQFGRPDTDSPDPAGRVPVWADASPSEIKAKFAELGLKPRQVTVLAAFLGPDREAVEDKLAEDPEFIPFVNKYRRSRRTVSENDYEVDLITAITKLSTLGTKINYEAYTFTPARPKLRF